MTVAKKLKNTDDVSQKDVTDTLESLTRVEADDLAGQSGVLTATVGPQQALFVSAGFVTIERTGRMIIKT
eukprot:5741938-Amphidinium_carterae.1